MTAPARTGPFVVVPLAIVAICVATGISAEPVGDPTFEDLLAAWHALSAGDRDAEVRRYLDQHGTTPVVRGRQVLFLVEGDELALHGDFNAWGEQKASAAMWQLAPTRWRYRIEQFRSDARIEYCFAEHKQCRRDPRNPHGVSTFGRHMSELRMPGFHEPRLPAAPLVAGRVTTFVHDSAALRNQRLVTVYVPDAAAARPQLPVVYFGDGQMYVDEIKAPAILDALIKSGVVSPVIGVFVPPVMRSLEYRGDEAHRRMLAFEIVQRVEKSFNAGGARERRYLVGSSRGARMALDLVAAYPEVFGRVALIAPAIRPSDLLDHIPTAPARTRVLIAAGEYDWEWVPDAMAIDQRLRAAGYDVTLRRYPDGHNPTAWRHLLHSLLPELMAPG